MDSGYRSTESRTQGRAILGLPRHNTTSEHSIHGDKLSEIWWCGALVPQHPIRNELLQIIRVAPLIRANCYVGFSSHDYTWTL